MCTPPRCCSAMREAQGTGHGVVSPDVGGGWSGARALAKRRTMRSWHHRKRRPRPNESKVMNIIGRVEGRTACWSTTWSTRRNVVPAAQRVEGRGPRSGWWPTSACRAVGLRDRAHYRNRCSDELVVTDTIPLSERAGRAAAYGSLERCAGCWRRRYGHQRRGSVSPRCTSMRRFWVDAPQTGRGAGNIRVFDATENESMKNSFELVASSRDARQRCEPPPASRRKRRQFLRRSLGSRALTLSHQKLMIMLENERFYSTILSPGSSAMRVAGPI